MPLYFHKDGDLMKKLILLFSLLGLFCLVSCNGGTDNTTDSSDSTNDTTSVPDDDTYDDNLPWGPFH